MQGDGIVILPPRDVLVTLKQLEKPVQTIVLDPWYNKGVGGSVPNYLDWLQQVVDACAEVSAHIFLWGFPEIVYKILDHLPSGFELITWLALRSTDLPTYRKA
jgi:site-specific DNA-methyltransferase (adenine-specific)